MALVVAAVASALGRLKAGKLGFPVAQDVRLDVAQLADLTMVK